MIRNKRTRPGSSQALILNPGFREYVFPNLALKSKSKATICNFNPECLLHIPRGNNTKLEYERTEEKRQKLKSIYCMPVYHHVIIAITPQGLETSTSPLFRLDLKLQLAIQTPRPWPIIPRDSKMATVQGIQDLVLRDAITLIPIEHAPRIDTTSANAPLKHLLSKNSHITHGP